MTFAPSAARSRTTEIASKLGVAACLYGAAVVASFLVGRVVGTDPLGVLFVLGATAVLLAAFLIRTGGHTRYHAKPRGGGLFRWLPKIEPDSSDAEARGAEIRRGVVLFAFGIVLWLTVLLLYKLLGAAPGLP